MTDLSSIIESLVSYFEADGVVSEQAKILSAYSMKKIPNPLLETYIVLNTEGAVIEDNDDYPPNDKVIHMTVSVNIHRAETSDPVLLLRSFSNIVGAMEASTVFNMTKAECKSVKRNADTNSVVLPCSVKFDLYYRSSVV